MEDGKWNWVYNDGDYAIEFVDLTDREFFDVYLKYTLVASFKSKKDALEWVGWQNYRSRKDVLQT